MLPAPGKSWVLTRFVARCVYLLAVVGLCCCARAFSSRGKQGLLFTEFLIVVCRFLIALASFVAERRLWACRLQ